MMKTAFKASSYINRGKRRIRLIQNGSEWFIHANLFVMVVKQIYHCHQ